MRGRMGICRRCHRDRRMGGRGLCTTCYGTVYKAGQLEEWPLMGPACVYPQPPIRDLRPDAPVADRCDWCRTPLTRSRRVGGEHLYEVYTVAGRVISVCFENCPTDRRASALELTEISNG